MTARILVCGSRTWIDKIVIARVFADLPIGTTIIQGAAKGADLLAAEVALQLSFKVKAFPANWNKHGKSAGPIRNQQMLNEGKPDRVIAFSMTNPISGGTKDMVTRAIKAGLQVEIYYNE